MLSNYALFIKAAAAEGTVVCDRLVFSGTANCTVRKKNKSEAMAALVSDKRIPYLSSMLC